MESFITQLFWCWHIDCFRIEPECDKWVATDPACFHQESQKAASGREAIASWFRDIREGYEMGIWDRHLGPRSACGLPWSRLGADTGIQHNNIHIQMRGDDGLCLGIKLQAGSCRGRRRAVMGIWMSRPRPLPSLGCNNMYMCQPWNTTIDTYEHIYNSNSFGNNICNVMWNGMEYTIWRQQYQQSHLQRLLW